jgi:hypothetical protein
VDARQREEEALLNDVVDSMRQEFPQVVDWLEALLSEEDFAFVAGSRVVGLGNAGSDFDVIPVFKRSVPTLLARQEGPRLPRLLMSARNQLLNVEDGMSLADLAEIRRQVEGLDPEDAQQLLDAHLPMRLDTYFRFCIGVPAVHAEAFHDVASRFDQAVYKRVAAAWLVVSCQRSLTEARFWALHSQPDAERLALEQAVSYAIGSHLLARGELYRPWARWRYEELGRAVGDSSTFFQRAWGLKAVGTRTLLEYHRQVEAFCLGVIEAQSRFEGYLTCSVKASGDVEPVWLDDAFFLIKNSSYCYEMKHPDVAAVWERIEGGFDLASIALAGSTQARQAESSVDEQLSFCLELERAGLVRIELSYRSRPSTVETDVIGSARPKLTRVEKTPGQLVLSRFYGHLIRGGFYSRPWASVMAAVRVEQWGIAMVRARDALRGAVDAALAMGGIAYSVDLRHARRELLETWGEEGPALARRYLDLELDNPISPGEVLVYVDRCREFIARILEGFPINSREVELSLDERHSLLLKSIEHAAEVAARLGVSTPLTDHAVGRISAFREAVASIPIIERRR